LHIACLLVAIPEEEEEEDFSSSANQLGCNLEQTTPPQSSMPLMLPLQCFVALSSELGC